MNDPTHCGHCHTALTATQSEVDMVLALGGDRDALHDYLVTDYGRTDLTI